jgi:hypothetical protein
MVTSLTCWRSADTAIVSDSRIQNKLTMLKKLKNSYARNSLESTSKSALILSVRARGSSRNVNAQRFDMVVKMRKYMSHTVVR